jgi:hypothetical protein
VAEGVRERRDDPQPRPGRHWINAEQRVPFLEAWQRFEKTRKADTLLRCMREPVRSRCEAAAQRLGLDPDELEGEMYSVLLLRKLDKHRPGQCQNDDHCVGLFGVYVDHAITDATRRLCRDRARASAAQPLHDSPHHTTSSDSDAFVEQEERRHNVIQLRRCQSEALGPEESRAIELAHIAPPGANQSEIARELGLSVRGLRKRLRVAEKKLLHCLQRKGVRL